MASYHFSVQLLKRSNGQSAVAAAAYRSGTALYDERRGKLSDYSRRGGVAYSEILLPPGADPGLSDRQTLWNQVEFMEKRKDAQLARDINLALPHELTASQRQNLLRAFVKEQFVKQGMIADIAIHAPQESKDDHPHNHHAHILLTLRKATASGLHPVKTREWNARDLLHGWREKWATIQNQYLERHGHKDRVDHRTLETQHRDALLRGDEHTAHALDRVPEIHVGKQGRHRNTANVTSRDRLVRTAANRKRYRFYTVTDKGSRTSFNTSILKHNRDLSAIRSRDLQVEKARLMQKRINNPHNRFSQTLHHWEQTKNLYGSLPANERPMNYWHALRDVISELPLKYRDNPYSIFAVPNFDDAPVSGNSKKSHWIFNKDEPFDSNKLKEETDRDVVDYFSLRKGLARLGLVGAKLTSLSARIGLAMDLEAIRNRRYFDFRKRYQQKQRRKRERNNVLSLHRFRKPSDDTK